MLDPQYLASLDRATYTQATLSRYGEKLKKWRNPDGTAARVYFAEDFMLLKRSPTRAIAYPLASENAAEIRSCEGKLIARVKREDESPKTAALREER